MIAQKNGSLGASRVLRQTTIAAIAALAVLAGVAPGSAQSQTIKIGVPVPLSGSSANAGTDIVNGAKLAAARINAWLRKRRSIGLTSFALRRPPAIGKA